ncbi:entericidin A/B family lipoprotein [Spiribacter halobius]|uniref:Entericidin n=1 Tax=Sediminicurvatus halobius TaxID=2182432 RepID=A0A2U2N4N9_9GAMM|nr:entericidin A/B family lipoprotein [Spiribacter halobius]PWG64043.1 entericidin [Spiribacter halobius]UEX76902.1 entericidin A/B family lipoprotein [Spiribacter halobius]
MQNRSFRWLPALLVALTMLGLTACNTMEGLGKDIQSAGRALEGKADESDGDESGSGE